MTAYLKYLRNERIRPKLEAERDAHLGPGGPANAKKGTVDVHRGGIPLYICLRHIQVYNLTHNLQINRDISICLLSSKSRTSHNSLKGKH